MPEEKELPARKEREFSEKMTISKTHYFLVWLLCICFFAGTILSAYHYYRVKAKYGELIDLAEIVDEKYYTDVDEEAALESAKAGYVAGLDDPYSLYRSPEEYDAFQLSESGQKVGVGFTVSYTEEGFLYVEAVEEGGAAEAAGIFPGDTVIAMNDVSLSTLTYDEILAVIQGEDAGTDFDMTVLRDGEEITTTVTRGYIDTLTSFGTMIETDRGNIGYIRIRSFKENTPEQFLEAYDTLLSDGATGVVFDVRGNGGGLLTAVEEILDPLVPEGNIAIATYRDGTTNTIAKSTSSETCDVPVAVLINENTASAAELFAASLRDFDGAILVGGTSFGKGIMQTTYSLENGGSVTLTTATYQTTLSDCYHGIGLEPDIAVDTPEATIYDTNPDISVDTQLSSAVDALLERM